MIVAGRTAGNSCLDFFLSSNSWEFQVTCCLLEMVDVDADPSRLRLTLLYFAAESLAAADETSVASSCRTEAARAMASSACFHCLCSMASRTAGMALAS